MASSRFGGVGPLKWNKLQGNIQKLHPLNVTQETFGGRTYDIFIKALTDEKYQLNAGDQAELTIIPDKLDSALGLDRLRARQGQHDRPSEDNRLVWSLLGRAVYYLTPTFHFLTEGERRPGALPQRQPVPRARRLDLRQHRWGERLARPAVRRFGHPQHLQLKAGVDPQPDRQGHLRAPSLRLLYGLQYSSQQAAFGTGFNSRSVAVSTSSRARERHWHSVARWRRKDGSETRRASARPLPGCGSRVSAARPCPRRRCAPRSRWCWSTDRRDGLSSGPSTKALETAVIAALDSGTSRPTWCRTPSSAAPSPRPTTPGGASSCSPTSARTPGAAGRDPGHLRRAHRAGTAGRSTRKLTAGKKDAPADAVSKTPTSRRCCSSSTRRSRRRWRRWRTCSPVARPRPSTRFIALTEKTSQAQLAEREVDGYDAIYFVLVDRFANGDRAQRRRRSTRRTLRPFTAATCRG